MMIAYIITGVITLAIFIYLLVVLFKPELF